jgi:catechol 2,3-dioxygenase-like lactoylglutathione lyase family enzyme
MLGSQDVTAFVARTQPEAAKRFYSETLGLRYVEESPYTRVFEPARSQSWRHP